MRSRGVGSFERGGGVSNKGDASCYLLQKGKGEGGSNPDGCQSGGLYLRHVDCEQSGYA